MSEEIKDVQEQEASASQENSADFETLLKEKDAEIENLKKMAQGQDKKNSQLFQEINDLKKVISEKDQTKKTVEQQFEELRQQFAEREAREKQKEKESLVNRIIAKNKLDPEFDFDFLFKYETEEMIEEKAALRAEYYKNLKEDGFKERVKGTPPVKGESVDSNALQDKTFFELNQLVKKNPQMEEAVLKEMDRRTQNG